MNASLPREPGPGASPNPLLVSFLPLVFISSHLIFLIAPFGLKPKELASCPLLYFIKTQITAKIKMLYPRRM